MRLVVRVDEHMVRTVERTLGQFHRKAPNVISRVLNRAATRMRQEAVKEVRQKYIIKAGDIKETMDITRASRNRLAAVVRSTGAVIPLDRFKISPFTVNPRRKSHIKAQVKKSGGKKPIPGAFVADIGGKKVFQRVGRERFPIKRLYGPTVPSMLNNDVVRRRIEQEGARYFQERLMHEVDRLLKRG